MGRLAAEFAPELQSPERPRMVRRDTTDLVAAAMARGGAQDVSNAWERAPNQMGTWQGAMTVRIVDGGSKHEAMRVSASAIRHLAGKKVRVDANRLTGRFAITVDPQGEFALNKIGYVGGPSLIRWLGQRGFVPGLYDAEAVAPGRIECRKETRKDTPPRRGPKRKGES